MKYRGTTQLTYNAVWCCGSRHPLYIIGSAVYLPMDVCGN